MKICRTGWEALGFGSYQDYLDSDMWKDKKRIFLSNVGRKCCHKCGTKIGLNIHHKHYENLGNESSKDLVILCFKCHEEEHK